MKLAVRCNADETSLTSKTLSCPVQLLPQKTGKCSSLTFFLVSQQNDPSVYQALSQSELNCFYFVTFISAGRPINKHRICETDQLENIESTFMSDVCSKFILLSHD